MTTDLKKILIVDDEALIAFEMAYCLEELGFDVVGPSLHLSDALTLAKEEELHAACLDVNLGKGDTAEPIARVLDQRGIPYVFLTAYDASQIDFVSANDIVMNKPVSAKQLQKVLLKVAA